MRVRIYKPAKSAMQSGRAGTKLWRIEPEFETPRTPEPLMGWVGAADTLNTQLRLKFESREAAEAYATRQGWDFAVDIPQARNIVPRSYIDNFKQKKKVS